MPKNNKKTAVPSASIGLADIGSNKFHFCVYNSEGKRIDHLDFQPALGQALSPKPPFFQDLNFENAVEALKKGAALFTKYGVSPDNSYCVATAAMREFIEIFEALKKTDDSDAQRIAKKKIQALHEAFSPYHFEVISEEKEAELVTIAAMEELYETAAPEIRALVKAAPLITVAHRGGRSTEIIDLMDGKIIQQQILHCGVLTPDLSFETELKNNWPQNDKPLLAVGGGIWRKAWEIIKHNGYAGTVLSREHAEILLEKMSKQNQKYFRQRGATKRAPHLAAGAVSLLELIRHTDAQQIIFLETKMVTALQPRIYHKWSDRLNAPQEPGSPCALLAPAQALPA